MKHFGTHATGYMASFFALFAVFCYVYGQDITPPRDAAVAAIIDAVFEANPAIRQVNVLVPGESDDWIVQSHTIVYEDVRRMVEQAAEAGYDHGAAYVDEGIEQPPELENGILPGWSRVNETRIPLDAVTGDAIGTWSIVPPNLSIDAAFTMNPNPQFNQADVRVVSKAANRQLSGIDWDITCKYDAETNSHHPLMRLRVGSTVAQLHARNFVFKRGIRYSARLTWNQERGNFSMYVNEQLLRQKTVGGEYRGGSTWRVHIGASSDPQNEHGQSAVFHGVIDHVIVRGGS